MLPVTPKKVRQNKKKFFRKNKKKSLKKTKQKNYLSVLCKKKTKKK